LATGGTRAGWARCFQVGVGVGIAIGIESHRPFDSDSTDWKPVERGCRFTPRVTRKQRCGGASRPRQSVKSVKSVDNPTAAFRFSSYDPLTRKQCKPFSCPVKNITFSAEESLIEQARDIARARRTTLNQLFREWLADLAGSKDRERAVSQLLSRLDYVRSSGPFTRDQMNER
jgi:hypothetical protein